MPGGTAAACIPFATGDVTLGASSVTTTIASADVATWSITGSANVNEGANASYTVSLSGTLQAGGTASINLALGAKAYAFVKRRGYVVPEDVRAVSLDVLRHRVAVTYEAEAEEVTSEQVVQEVLNKIEVP